MGGANGDRRWIVPLCTEHHAREEGKSLEWSRRHLGVDLVAEAERLDREWCEISGEGET